MQNISFTDIIEDSKKLSNVIRESNMEFDLVVSIPSGGVLPAYIVSQELGVPLLENGTSVEGKKVLIIDDLIDSGITLKKYVKEYEDKGAQLVKTAVVYNKTVDRDIEPHYYQVGKENDWVSLPHESEGGIEDNIRRTLQLLGEDVSREGLLETPRRVAKAYGKLFEGYEKKSEDFMTIFEGENYDQMVILKDIEYYSHCEHHMIPFFGKAHIAYIPDKKIVGVSKLARLVDMYARRLQNQERLTMQVAEELQRVLSPKGVAVVFEGEHLCMKARGVEKQSSKMKTSHLTGVFRDNLDTRQEFYHLIEN